MRAFSANAQPVSTRLPASRSHTHTASTRPLQKPRQLQTPRRRITSHDAVPEGMTTNRGGCAIYTCGLGRADARTSERTDERTDGPPDGRTHGRDRQNRVASVQLCCRVALVLATDGCARAPDSLPEYRRARRHNPQRSVTFEFTWSLTVSAPRWCGCGSSAAGTRRRRCPTPEADETPPSRRVACCLHTSADIDPREPERT